MSTVAIIGGTGLLGRATAEELLAHGYDVLSIALPPETAHPLEGVRYAYCDVAAASDDELLALLDGVDAVAYAAGVDERVAPQAPAAGFFYRANVLPTQRMARLARQAGVSSFVVFGSYFAEFAERWPELGLREKAGYVRTRLLQEQVAFLEGDGAMTVTSLRLPWIFGTMPDTVPLWSMFVAMDAAVPEDAPIAVPAGGTVMITTGQVAKAARGAIERGEHGKTYALGGINMTYADFHRMIAEEAGMDPARVTPLPAEVFLPGMTAYDKAEAARGIEHGMHQEDAARVQERFAYIDPEPVQAALGYGPEDVEAAIRESLRVCVAATTAMA
ncbi:NAD-dependent epimerase/dehydratase family protein [Microbacterium sp. zg.Y1090]|uniref:NAD-dependent epimerase/dehydratase family protein n=1 Tax=Microbacterium TaxID=33882 RepID=UPI00214BB9E6|nr:MULTISPECIES: NAD-dependent epimerase/dehydratase family protein [unclassified Microbacterium]MCR2812575.1 NAD-dependent epimerase/dehydratase family protein [Microbacterium sp. zg.Y1084]MCR2817624.1 NAD-dependent epimerase/dehydratase family protein [Microbacterium sp. zg.Y1090]MDL5485733.1 NAD-dependent epimerase/dehydratase family protein [Microbacterium sp. zg-Y1211]WIM28900.1 NAD-dependent epimerase/dehydratase family protein [Microbacterium sp. zg-Y1090]